jgi:hypothetical protein
MAALFHGRLHYDVSNLFTWESLENTAKGMKEVPFPYLSYSLKSRGKAAVAAQSLRTVRNSNAMMLTTMIMKVVRAVIT